MSDSIQTIRRSVKHFFSGTLLSRIAGMLRDVSMAYVFGTQSAIAAFMLAFRLAHLLRRLFGEGALQSAFIPEFEALRHHNPEKAFFFFRNLYAILTFFLLILITLGCLSLRGLTLSGFLSEGSLEVILLTTTMLPSLLFICLYGFNASLLQCQKRFFISSVAPVAFNGIWILTIFLLKYYHLTGPEAMPWLAYGVVLACFGQWLITLPQVFFILKNNLPSLWKGPFLYLPDLLKVGRPLLLGIIGVAAFQVNNAVDAIFARYAEPEGPALLWYAIRIQQLPLALFGIAVSGAILPPLARAIKALDWANYYHFLNYALKQTIGLMIPISCALFVLGDTCTNLIYGRGNFTDHSIIGTTHCLWAYTLGLIPSTLVLILAPACYAQNDYRLPAYAAFLTMIVNCVLNSFMIVGFGLGAMSVALATSISAWLNLLFLSFSLSKKNGPIFSFALIKYIGKVGTITLVASIMTLIFRAYTEKLSLIDILMLKNILFPQGINAQFLAFIQQAIIFACLCGTGLFLLKMRSAKKQQVS